jgi:hypothetical protein
MTKILKTTAVAAVLVALVWQYGNLFHQKKEPVQAVQKELPIPKEPPGLAKPPETEIPDIRGKWEARESLGESVTRYAWEIQGETPQSGTYTMDVLVMSMAGADGDTVPPESAHIVGTWTTGHEKGLPAIKLRPKHTPELTVIRNLSGWDSSGAQKPKALITSAPKGGETFLWRKKP